MNRIEDFGKDEGTLEMILEYSYMYRYCYHQK